jgi:formate C-acetyltransferase
MATNTTITPVARAAPWDGFVPGRWQDDVDVRDFIQRNYTPYAGDGAFLAGPTDRTRAVWRRLADLMAQERARGGLLDVDASTPASITAHGPGYIDRERELIVGLQTDAPLKRAIMPKGRLADDRDRAAGVRGRARRARA